MSNTQRSTMFLSEISVVDHAYISDTGTIIGGSWNPSFLVSGKIDPVEKVVVDFSTIKKQLKNYIDDDVVGFDHKLWVIDGFSNIVEYAVGNNKVTFDELLDPDLYSPYEAITITTPVNSVTAPKNAFKFIKAEPGQVYSTHTAGVWIAEFLNSVFNGTEATIDCGMAAATIDQDIRVECTNTLNAHTYVDAKDTPIGLFTYTHGLKDSTSWGCQNLGHGHMSFIQVVVAEQYRLPGDLHAKITNIIALELNNTTFINRDNITSEDDTQLTISYTTPRGTFTATYQKSDEDNNLVVLDTETTIEFLVDYVNERFRDELDSIGAISLFVSEGLSKGAYIDLAQ